MKKLDVLKEVFYKLPLCLEVDEKGDLYGYNAWSNTNNHALTFGGDNNHQHIKMIVHIINGYKNTENNFLLSGWTRDGEDFSHNGKYMFCIRGWGRLTSKYNLSIENAISVQEVFAEILLKKLNGYES